MFWGRVRGAASDYYIAIGVKFAEHEFPSKSFYYATAGFHFQRLPALQGLFKDRIEECTAPFSGNPDLQLFEVLEVKVIPRTLLPLELPEEALEVDPPTQPSGGQDKETSRTAGNDSNPTASRLEELELPTPEELPEQREERQVACRELDRLAYVVRAIEFECSCLPVGALRMVLTHEVRYSDGFRGLDVRSALDKSSWLHFRQPLGPEQRAVIERPDVVFRPGFLEDITGDLPLNSWSLQPSVTNEFVG